MCWGDLGVCWICWLADSLGLLFGGWVFLALHSCRFAVICFGVVCVCGGWLLVVVISLIVVVVMLACCLIFLVWWVHCLPFGVRLTLILCWCLVIVFFVLVLFCLVWVFQVRLLIVFCF